jgi:peroxiredoxin
MAITVGDRLPDATFMVMGPDGAAAPKPASEVFAGKRVALFGVPGAYTRICHGQHMPGFVARVEELRAKGIDIVACTAVNDIYVLTRWAEDTNAAGRILMLADGNADFARRIGLDVDMSARGFGIRSKRYAMLVEDNVVKVLNVEEQAGHHDTSSAATLCAMVDRAL